MSEPTPPGQPIPDRGPELVRVLWPLTALAFITVVMRLWVRLRHARIGWDDFFMILTMGCFIAHSVVLTIYVSRGGNQHQADVVQTGLINVSRVIFMNLLALFWGIMGVAFGKVSVSCLLLNIIQQTDLKWQRWYLWTVTITLSMLGALVCMLASFLQCSPPNALWDRWVQGKCANPEAMAAAGIFLGAWNTFADASLALVPITIFWKLHCSTAEKAQLYIVFGFNIFTSICAGIKTKYLIDLGNRDDFTWVSHNIFAWKTGELFLIIICGTLPTLNPFLIWVRRTVMGQTTKSSSSDLSPKGGSRMSHGMQQELGTMKKTTIVQRGESLAEFGESNDNLVGSSKDGKPGFGIRPDVARYHVKITSEVRSSRSSQS